MLRRVEVRESPLLTVPVHSERIYFRVPWNLISGSVHTGIPEVFVVVVMVVCVSLPDSEFSLRFHFVSAGFANLLWNSPPFLCR